MRFRRPLHVAASLGSALSLSLALASVSGCSSNVDGDSGTDQGAATAATDSGAACSSDYWKWTLNTLAPNFARPASEVSEDALMAIVANHPSAEENEDTYGICWQPIFAKYFIGDALYRLHTAGVTYLDPNSPGHLSLPKYQENVAMTPELRRNAKALIALRPSTLKPTDTDTWLATYDTFLAEAIRPVATPGPYFYEDVKEAEWVVDQPEQEYLAVVEAALSKPSADGVYGFWIEDYAKWLFGPPPSATLSFVFNVEWEPGKSGSDYGLTGLVLSASGQPYLPDPVQAFLKRFQSVMPASLGPSDSASWFTKYHARMIRTIADLPQDQPVLTATDSLALDLLTQVKPTRLMGLFSYQSWADLVNLAKTRPEARWMDRLVPLEPCVPSADLDAATKTFSEQIATSGGTTVAPPHACQE